LEKKYDKFLEINQHLLFLQDTIDFYLDIRDALTIQLQRLEREERKKIYYQQSILETETKCEYRHEFQNMLPDNIKLTKEQIEKGYIPCPNEPKEYKCGCLTMKYYAPCCCKRISALCENPRCNEKIHPNIKTQYYCINHHILLSKQERLKSELSKIEKELSLIRRQSNSFDYDDYKNSIAKHPKQKRVSRFPWKNI
jgi:hypothetical protein